MHSRKNILRLTMRYFVVGVLVLVKSTKLCEERIGLCQSFFDSKTYKIVRKYLNPVRILSDFPVNIYYTPIEFTAKSDCRPPASTPTTKYLIVMRRIFFRECMAKTGGVPGYIEDFCHVLSKK